ncbi:MAG: OmpA family protein, partial [Bacteroidota bacterium]
ISADGELMFFTSRREGSTGGTRDGEGEFYEDIYFSTLDNGTWTAAKNLGGPINTSGHDAIIGLSPDGQRMFLYVSEAGDGNIYQCRLNGDQWSKPERLPKPINTSYQETSASISYDGNTMCWVSDRPGGQGGTDIYMSAKSRDGKWGEAVNLGPAVNTPWNEVGVFLLPDGKTMYFSSEGHTSMGGLDIFKTVLDNGKWSTPENIGYPFNTPDNDVFFVVSANGRSGYFSSIRDNGTGEVDIYRFELPPVVVPAPVVAVKDSVVATVVQEVTPQVTLVKGVISDFMGGQPLEAKIQMVDNDKNEVIAEGSSNSRSGKYLFTLPSGRNYAIVVRRDDYLFHSENFDLPAGQGYQEIRKDIQLKKIAVGNKIVLNNIFFEYNKATLSSDSYHELENLFSLLKESPTIRMEISGHTDGKGSAAGNLSLSQERANSVVAWLVGKGISPDRLVAKGYGLTRPVAGNDTEEGRKQNRRTEFEILSK